VKKTYYRWIPPAVFIICCVLAFVVRFLFYVLMLENFEHLPALILALGLSTAVVLAAMSEFVEVARQRAERLRESEARFRSVTESANDAIVIAGGDGHILSWNRAAERVFGISAEAAVGRPFDIIMPERHRATIARIASGRDTGALHEPMEIEGLRADGKEIPLELSVSTWTLDDQHFFSGMMRDISHRRANEQHVRQLHRELESRVRERTAELKRSNEDLQQFAYVASHDLQEPLRVVSNFTQLLSRRYRGKLGADADEFIGFTIDGCQRMQQLISDLLSYCRVDTAGAFKRVDLNEALEQALANLALAIEESGATIVHDELPAVEGDRIQIVQLLQNLVGNAIKFRDKRPPVVTIGARRDGDFWTFFVRDNGIGLDPKHAERIFVIFQRLHGRGEYKGTGIGLSICKKIVERHGGRMWVESQPGEGSAFHFTLPTAPELPLPAGSVDDRQEVLQ
jgi:PAS domain S-box-containing protein